MGTNGNRVYCNISRIERYVRQMIERCTSIWEPEAPADLTVHGYMGTN